MSKLGNVGVVMLALVLGVAGCNKQSDNAAQSQDQQDPNYDPASANMAPEDQSAPVNESAAPAASTSSAPAPAQASSQSTATSSDDVPPPPPDESTGSYPADNTVSSTEVPADQSGYYDTAAVEQPVYAPQPPPPLPVYDQPVCPGPNYIWTPGYWAYQPVGYYWVPGVWVIAPYIGALWTPGYWGWFGGHYRWNHGYWGPHIGYYGGINYGHGYVGRGYYGGYWNHNNFYYNRTITNVNTTVVKNVYVHNVTINNVTINNYNNSRVAYNGGQGGIQVRPTPGELQASRERHLPPLTAQTQHAREAGQNRAQFFSANQGRPQTVALNRPLATPFRQPAAQPPTRGVANPGFVERQNRPVNETRVQPRLPAQQPVARSGAVTAVRPQQQPEPQHPNLIRPQAHPESTAPMRQPESRPAQQEQPRPQPERQPQAQQPREPQPRQEPQSRPQSQPQSQGRPEAHPQPQREQPSRPEPRQEPQSRPQQEKPHAAIRQEIHTAPQPGPRGGHAQGKGH